MLEDFDYLLESGDEALRLDIKTEEGAVERQALWAGIAPGMRVADICCGSGKTTWILNELVQPFGSAIGIDGSEKRLEYARIHYSNGGIEFFQHDITESLRDLGTFDFVWVRFVLEYFRANGFDVVENISGIVRPGGILCLIDLDYNSQNHYKLPDRLALTLCDLSSAAEEKANFDPYAGRKLYSHLYRLGYGDLAVDVAAHHLIYGPLKQTDAFNWSKKTEVVAKRLGYDFKEYPGGYDEFFREFTNFFQDPGRFTYTPIIACRGRRPLH
jgi:SAM-dependent methyltransferase